MSVRCVSYKLFFNHPPKDMVQMCKISKSNLSNIFIQHRSITFNFRKFSIVSSYIWTELYSLNQSTNINLSSYLNVILIIFKIKTVKVIFQRKTKSRISKAGLRWSTEYSVPRTDLCAQPWWCRLPRACIRSGLQINNERHSPSRQSCRPNSEYGSQESQG